MELTFAGMVLIPIGLGLLGFVEPCTIGAHLIFYSSQVERRDADKAAALIAFIISRMIVMGLFGAAVHVAGRQVISVQPGFWLVFGLVYFTVGIVYASGRARSFTGLITLAPEAWRRARNPVALGAAFGLSIPACAAPIIFGLLGVTATSGSTAAAFFMMALLGLALSAPLVAIALHPGLAARLTRAADWMRARRWILGGVFMALGLWSIYFGLFVDPADWSGG